MRTADVAATARLLLVAAACLLVVACAVRETRPQGAWLEERRALFADHPNWVVSGRAALRDGRRGGQLSFTWQARGDRHIIDLRTVTGGKRWRLEFEPGRAELVGSEVGRLVGSEPEPLVEQAVGWPIPVSRLSDWIRALVSDAEEHVVYADDGTIKGLNGEDWLLEYRRFETVDEVLMPTLLEARSDSYRVRLVMRDWDWAVGAEKKPL